jgi:hypothetical protein
LAQFWEHFTIKETMDTAMNCVSHARECNAQLYARPFVALDLKRKVTTVW